MQPDFLYKWQTLVGSFLGPFLAVTFSAVGFYIKKRLDRKIKYKRTQGRIDITLAQSINYLSDTMLQLDAFLKRVDFVVAEVKKITDASTYALQETNFPPVVDIPFDKDLSKMPFKSYYLHNKVLSSEKIIAWANSSFRQVRIDYEKLLRRNELLIEKMPPDLQRESYISNLKGYSDMLKTILDDLKNDKLKFLITTKLYNLILLESPIKALWKHEGISFKYFRNRKTIKHFNQSSYTIERIDKSLEPESTHKHNKILNKYSNLNN